MAHWHGRDVYITFILEACKSLSCLYILLFSPVSLKHSILPLSEFAFSSVFMTQKVVTDLRAVRQILVWLALSTPRFVLRFQKIHSIPVLKVYDIKIRIIYYYYASVLFNSCSVLCILSIELLNNLRPTKGTEIILDLKTYPSPCPSARESHFLGFGPSRSDEICLVQHLSGRQPPVHTARPAGYECKAKTGIIPSSETVICIYYYDLLLLTFASSEVLNL